MHLDSQSQSPSATVRAVALLLVAGALLALVAGCASESVESIVPANILPEEGTPVVYEFYTDT